MDFILGGFFGFLFGMGFWGWALVLVELAILFPLTAYEKSEAAFVTLVAFAVVAYFILGWNVLTAIWHHPVMTVFIVVGYFAAGALWSIYLWRIFARAAREAFESSKVSFINSWTERLAGQTRLTTNRGIEKEFDDAAREAALSQLRQGQIPEKLLQDWHSSRAGLVYPKCPPQPRCHKRMLTTWIAFWPWSLTWYVIRDLFLEVVNAIYRQLVGMYTRISDKQFEDVDPRLLQR